MLTHTAPSAPAATFGTPVEITAIARELKKLWQADQTRTRASLINSAVICEGEVAMQDSTELLERFVRTHSFHALLIGINPHARARRGALLRRRRATPRPRKNRSAFHLHSH